MAKILLSLSKKTEQELNELFNNKKSSLRDFIKDQILEMAVTKKMDQEVKIANEKIKAIQIELEKTKQAMKEDVDK